MKKYIVFLIIFSNFLSLGFSQNTSKTDIDQAVSALKSDAYNFKITYYYYYASYDRWMDITPLKYNNGILSFREDYDSDKVNFSLKDVSIGSIKEATYHRKEWDGKIRTLKKYNLSINCKECITLYRTLKSSLIIATDNKTVLERFKKDLINLQLLEKSKESQLNNNHLAQNKNQDNISPKIVISNIEFKDQNKNKRIDQQENCYFVLTLKNYGQKEEKNISVKVNELNNLHGISVNNKQLPIIQSNQSKTLKIPINSYNDLETGDAKFEFIIQCANNDITKKQVQITALNSGSKKIVISTIPDVDKNIPVTTNQRNNTYALIIGNEDYKSKQHNLSIESNVQFAINDAKIIKEYFNKTLGIPNVNINLITNATSAQINQGINKFKLIPKINPNAKIIFYYAGHGLPDQISKEQYIIPVDVNGSNVTYGIKVNDIISNLNINNPKKVIIILDACFSGAGRNESLLSNRGVKIVPKENIIKNNTIILSSSSKSEPSKAYIEMQHGMFTYFLLKNLKKTKGNSSLQNIYDYLYFQIREKSLLINNQIQTPTIIKSPTFSKSLNEIKF